MLCLLPKGYTAPLPARLPGLAERPERDPEQGQVLEEELARFPRQGGEAAGTGLPNARRGDEEAEGREEHPDRQGTAEGGCPGRERSRGNKQRGDDLDDAKRGREAADAQEPVDPAHQRAVVDVHADPSGLVRRELHETDPRHHDHQAVAGQRAADRLHAGTQRRLLLGSRLYLFHSGGQCRVVGGTASNHVCLLLCCQSGCLATPDGRSNANPVPSPGTSPGRGRNCLRSRTFGPTPAGKDDTAPNRCHHRCHGISWKLTTVRGTATRGGRQAAGAPGAAVPVAGRR